MKSCPRCESQIPEGADYCPECGAQIVGAAEKVPDFVKRQLVEGEKVEDKWYLRGLIAREYLITTSKRSIIYRRGAFKLSESSTDFVHHYVSSVEALKKKPLTCLVGFLIMIISVMLGLLSGSILVAAAGCGIAAFISAGGITSYMGRRFGIGMGIVTALWTFGILVASIAASAGEGGFVAGLLALIGIGYGSLALVLFIVGLNFTTFHVVGAGRYTIHRYITDAIKSIRRWELAPEREA